MDKILLKWPRLTTAQVILALTFFIAIWLGFLTTDIVYNRALNSANTASIAEQTNAIHDLISKQGNLSNSQRQTLIQQFEDISKHGGFATNESISANLHQTFINKHNIEGILANMTSLNVKLDKLLNQTFSSK